MESKIVCATMTLAKDVMDADRLYESVRILVSTLSGRGCPVVIADGGSPAGFIRRIRALPDVILSTRPDRDPRGLVPQVKRALAEARKQDPSFVLYTEPDKSWFFEHHLVPFLGQAADHPQAGLIVAARDKESFATFPLGQRRTEDALNRLCAEFLGPSGDFVYGPLLINSGLLPYVDKIPDDLGWGWRTFLLAVACRKPYLLVPYTAYFPCPEPQRTEDGEKDRIYRLRQLAENVRGLAEGMEWRW